MVESCCAVNCKNRRKKGTKMKFHRIPKDSHLRKLWLLAIRRVNFYPSETTVICEKHFKLEDYEINVHGNRVLKKTAVPSKFDIPAHLEKEVKTRKPLIEDLSPETEESNENEILGNELFEPGTLGLLKNVSESDSTEISSNIKATLRKVSVHENIVLKKTAVLSEVDNTDHLEKEVKTRKLLNEDLEYSSPEAEESNENERLSGTSGLPKIVTKSDSAESSSNIEASSPRTRRNRVVKNTIVLSKFDIPGPFKNEVKTRKTLREDLKDSSSQSEEMKENEPLDDDLFEPDTSGLPKNVPKPDSADTSSNIKATSPRTRREPVIFGEKNVRGNRVVKNTIVLSKFDIPAHLEKEVKTTKPLKRKLEDSNSEAEESNENELHIDELIEPGSSGLPKNVTKSDSVDTSSNIKATSPRTTREPVFFGEKHVHKNRVLKNTIVLSKFDISAPLENEMEPGKPLIEDLEDSSLEAEESDENEALDDDYDELYESSSSGLPENVSKSDSVGTLSNIQATPSRSRREPVFFGDFIFSDLNEIDRRKRFWKVAQETVNKLKKMNQYKQCRIGRQEAKIKNLNNLVDELLKKKKIFLSRAKNPQNIVQN